MQAEILSANPDSAIRILGVNEDGQQGSNDLAVANRTLPWLQDIDGAAWAGWTVTYRDVVLLDAENRKVAVFNLTDHDLGRPEEYAALLALLRASAGE
jgi:hypothetical protein